MDWSCVMGMVLMAEAHKLTLSRTRWTPPSLFFIRTIPGRNGCLTIFAEATMSTVSGIYIVNILLAAELQKKAGANPIGPVGASRVLCSTV